MGNQDLSVIKISDFGTSFYSDQPKKLNFTKYQPRDTNKYSTAFDIWQLGLLIYELFSGNSVWQSCYKEAMLDEIHFNLIPFYDKNDKIGLEQIDEIVEKCVQYQQQMRPNCQFI
eukprot:TRINITY_DN16149_c0_g1_i1.p3 TRINITY_DN16149_c0_g1~~TRINITY_DN16149_c0_g1_i1.p3  ORF type:complete len:115 (+),score=16.82 TRINITY_DN16149_c0_g1_i1:111-455(+)